MYKLWFIVWFRLKLIFKSKIAWMMLFILPILFCLIFGSMGLSNRALDNSPHVGIVVENCKECNLVAQYLQRNVNYSWKLLELEKAKAAVTDNHIIAAVIVPFNIYDRLQKSEAIFDIIVNSKKEHYIPFSHYIDSVANQLHMFNSTLNIVEQTSLIHNSIHYVNHVPPIMFEHSYYINPLVEHKEKPRTSVTISLGFTVMFMLFAMVNIASVIHLERKQFAWQRLISTGTSTVVITVGTLIAFFIVGWLQFGIVILFMNIVFGVHWGSLLYLIVFASLMIMAVVSCSMLIATLFSSKDRTDMFSALLVVSTCMLGGVYWPIEFVPTSMQILAMITPQYWMMRGLENGLMHETELAIIWLPFAVLLFVTILFSIIVAKNLNKETRLA